MRNKLGWLRTGSKGRPLWTLWCTVRFIKQGIPGLDEQGRVQHCLKYFSSLSLRGRTKWQAAKQAMYTGRTVPTTGVWIFSWQINNDYTCHLQLGDLLELRKRRERRRTQCVNISCIFLYIYLYSQLYNITCNKLKPKGRHIFVNILSTVSIHHTSRQEAIIRLYLATCILFLLYLNIVLRWPEDGRLRPKHVTKYNLIVIIAPCLDLCCVLTVHNILYKSDIHNGMASL